MREVRTTTGIKATTHKTQHLMTRNKQRSRRHKRPTTLGKNAKRKQQQTEENIDKGQHRKQHRNKYGLGKSNGWNGDRV